jgi:hypothetical protein
MLARNTLPASIVLPPAIALGLSGLGRVSGSSRPAFARLLVHGLSAVAVVTTAMQFTVPASALEPYPQEALAWMRQEGLLDTSSRIVTRDIVGNYMTYAYGPDEVRVFIDDRVDMYPPDVLSHYLDMIRAGRDHAGAIEAVDPSAVLWNIRSELGRWLAESDEWNVVWTDDTWLVAVPER